jgi:hypothetical protein
VSYADGEVKFKCLDRWWSNLFMWFLAHHIKIWVEIVESKCGINSGTSLPNTFGPEGPVLVQDLFSGGGGVGVGKR